MTGRLIATICVLILLLNVPLLGQQYYEFDANVDLRNQLNPQPPQCYPTGLDAMWGHTCNGVTVTGHYDGNPDWISGGWFANFTWHTVQWGDTWLKWRDFRDGTNDIIDPGQRIHVGWRIKCLYMNEGPIMFWTDDDGHHLENCYVCNLHPHWQTYPDMKELGVKWNGYSHYKSLCDCPISISNAVYAVLDSPVPLDSLNANNDALAAVFDSLPGGGNFTVFPDSQVTRVISGVDTGTYVVLRYEVTSPEVATLVTNYVQIYVSSSAAIPTLTEWGMIIFCVLLFGWMAWVIVRRRKAVKVRI